MVSKLDYCHYNSIILFYFQMSTRSGSSRRFVDLFSSLYFSVGNFIFCVEVDGWVGNLFFLSRG